MARHCRCASGCSERSGLPVDCVAIRLRHLITMALIGALASFALSGQLFGETDYVVPPGRAAFPIVITVGPDGNVWFTENAGLKIGTANADGVVTEFPITGAQGLCGITAGPDGTIWFTDEFAGTIGHISITGGALGTYNLPPGSHPQGIVTGPDSKLWFVDNSVDSLHPANGFRVGSIDTAGNITEYSTSINPGVFDTYGYPPAQITVGPDKNLWFTNANASEVGTNFVGTITTAGAVTVYSTGDTPQGITSGPDGNLWVIENKHVAKITTSGMETEYLLNGVGYGGITLGPDENIWFTEYTAVGFVVPATGTVTELPASTFSNFSFISSITAGPVRELWFLGNLTSNIGRLTIEGQLVGFSNLNLGSLPGEDTLGPDGAIWATQFIADSVSRLTTSGQVTSFPTPAGSIPGFIVAGPDGNLWFTEGGPSKVAKMATSGQILAEYQAKGSLGSLAFGPDGNLWFPQAGAANSIARLTTSGVLTEFSIPTQNAGAGYITKGPDGNLWFTESNAQQVAKIDPNSGLITEYPFSSANQPPEAIVTGPDGNLWIMAGFANGAIAKFSISGSLLAEYPAQFLTSLDIKAGTDGALWFPQYYPNGVGRITTSGVVSYVPLTTPNAEPNDLAFAANGKLCVAEISAGALGCLSAIGGTGKAVTATAGSPFTGAVASFVDGTPTASAANFTAIINWGDGTQSPGTVSGPTGGPFTVSGTHTYSVPQTYPTIVSLYDSVDNAMYQASPGSALVQSGSFTILLSPASATVTQSFSNLNDPFFAHPIKVTAQPLNGYNNTVTLSCSVSPPLTGGSCAVEPPSSGSLASGNLNTTLTISAGSSTPVGCYTVTVTGQDNTGLMHSATLALSVINLANGVDMPPGGSNRTPVSFGCPTGTVISNLSCTLVAGTGITGTEDLSKIGGVCTFNPGSLTTPGMAVVTISGCTVAQLRMRMPIFASFFLGMPGVVLLGSLRRGKRRPKNLLWILAFVLIASALLVGVGCGGYGQLTPTGNYFVLVQGTGANGTVSSAVVPVTVTPLN